VGDIDPQGQFGHHLTHHRDVLTGDQPRTPSRGSRGQHRRQGLPGEGPPRPQLGSLTQPTPHLPRGQAPPDRQHRPPRLGTHLLGRGLRLQRGQHAVQLGGQLTRQGLQLVHHRDQLRPREQLHLAGSQSVVPGTQRRHRILHRHPHHHSNIHSTTDKHSDHVTPET
jgi:hypothetical protein